MSSDVTLLLLVFNLVTQKTIQKRDRKSDGNKKVEILNLPMCQALGLVSYMWYVMGSSLLLILEIRKQESQRTLAKVTEQVTR